MSYNIAEANAYTGNVDEAYRWLQTAYEYRHGGLTEIKTNPLMARLYGEPRWDGYLTKLGLNDVRLAAIDFTVASDSGAVDST